MTATEHPPLRPLLWLLLGLLSALVLAPRLASAQPEPSVAVALAEGDRLTLDEAVERAISVAPSLDAAEADAAVVRADASATRVGLFPRAQLDASYTRIGGFDDGSIQGPAGPITIDVPRNRTRFRAQVEASLTDPFVRVLPAVRALEAQAEAVARDGGDARQQVTLATTLAYLAYADARAAEAVTAVSRRRVEDQLERLRAMHGAGLASEVAVIDAEAHLAEVDARIAQADARVRVAAEALASWMDEAPERWAVDVPSAAPTAAVDSLVDRAIASRPSLQALRLRLEATDASARAARGGRWPSIGTYAAFEVANPNVNVIPPEDRFQRSWELGVFARWSPNALVRANRETDRAEAQREALRARFEGLSDQVRLEVRQSVATLEAAHASLTAAEARERAARRAYEAYVAELAAGRAVLTELLAAEEGLAAAELGTWQARSAIAAADARLRVAVGE